MKILLSGVVATISSHSPGVPTYSLSSTIILFSFILLSCSQCKTYHHYSTIQMSYLCQTQKQTFVYVHFFFTIIIIAVMDGNSGIVVTLGKFFIPSLIGYNSLTRPSFKSFCMSANGLKSFESSYCELKSTTRCHKKCCWMFYLVLRNSLTIKSLFLESVIFRNEMFLLAIFLIFRTWF